MLDLILLLNVIKIQILAGTVVKQQLSFLEDICCYIVCQIKAGMLIWFKPHQHWFNVVTLDENWYLSCALTGILWSVFVIQDYTKYHFKMD